MLRIAAVTSHFPSAGASTQGRSTYETFRRLAKECTLRVFYPRAAYPGILKKNGWPGKDSIAGFRVPEIDVSYHEYRALPIISRPFNGTMAARAVLPHVRSFCPDLIVSYSLYPSAFAGLKIAAALSVPVVAVAVGSDIHSIGDPFVKMHTSRVLREIDYLVTVSEDLRSRAIGLDAQAERSRTIINGCDRAVFHPMDRKEARRQLGMATDVEAIVYIGRMDLRKGLQELAGASAQLRRERPRLHTYLVGDGPDKPLVEAVIRANSAGEHVHLLPGCSFDEVAIWMAAADVTTLPSYMEGCPNTVLESLACGRPVVATHVGGIPEIMSEECGRLVPPRDTGALVQAFVSVLNRKWDATAISSKWARGWEECAAELLQTFEPLLAGRLKAAKNS